MGNSLNDFKFSASIGRFSSDGAAGTAVKGLILSASSSVGSSGATIFIILLRLCGICFFRPL